MPEIAELTLAIDSSQAAKSLERIEAKMDGFSKKAGTSVDKVDSKFGKLKNTLLSFKGIVIGVGLVASLKGAISAATDFQSAMAEVNTLISQDSQQAFAGLSDEIRRVSKEFGSTATDQAGAAYQIISAGASNSADAISRLEAANRLAIGGVTDITTAADGLTSVLNAYGEAAGSVKDVSDAFFDAMKAGKTTVGELSASIGQVAPVAANLNVSLEEVLAATSALTKGGINTAIAMRGLRQVMANVVKPTSEAREEASRLGLQFDAAAIQSKGLQGFLADVVTQTKGNTASLAKLFGSVEALVPILQLAGAGAKDFEEILKTMETTSGSTEEAFEKMKDTFDFQFNKLKAEIMDVAIALGNAMLPVLRDLVVVARDTIKFVQANAEAFKTLAQAVATVGIMKFLPPLLGLVGRGFAAATVASLGFGASLLTVSGRASIASTAITTLGKAVRFLGGPIGIVVGLLTTLAFNLINSADEAKELEDRIRGTGNEALTATDKIAQMNRELEDQALLRAKEDIRVLENRLMELNKQFEITTRQLGERDAVEKWNDEIINQSELITIAKNKLSDLTDEIKRNNEERNKPKQDITKPKKEGGVTTTQNEEVTDLIDSLAKEEEAFQTSYERREARFDEHQRKIQELSNKNVISKQKENELLYQLDELRFAAIEEQFRKVEEQEAAKEQRNLDRQARETERLLEGMKTEETRLQEKHMRELELLEAHELAKLELRGVYDTLEQEDALAQSEALAALRQRQEDEMYKVQVKNGNRSLEFDRMTHKQKVAMFRNLTGMLSGLMQSENKKMFEIGKKAAIAEAIINTYQGITESLSAYPFPFNAVAAAATAALGFIQVQKIKSTQFGSGSSGVSVGGGGVAVGTNFNGGAGQAPQARGGLTTEPQVETAPRQRDVTIDLGDDDELITKGAVRNLIGRINEELGDGVVLNTT